MSFRLRIGEREDTALRRIASWQCRRLRHLLPELALAPEAVCHDLRTGCKRLRGLLRLLRTPLGDDFSPADALLRDAARALAGPRDATAMLECLDSLKNPPPDADGEASGSGLAVPGSVSDAFRAAERAREPSARAVRSFTRSLDRFEALIPAWQLRPGTAPRWRTDLRRTYRRARNGARQPGTDAAGFHAWRKAVKYHRHHVLLLSKAWPDWFAARARRLDELGEVLGQEHDLSVMLVCLDLEPKHYGTRTTLKPFIRELKTRRRLLRRRAQVLAQPLFSSPPATFTADVMRIHRLALELPPRPIRAGVAKQV
jgi:CHAD domain-containing protein